MFYGILYVFTFLKGFQIELQAVHQILPHPHMTHSADNAYWLEPGLSLFVNELLSTTCIRGSLCRSCPVLYQGLIRPCFSAVTRHSSPLGVLKPGSNGHSFLNNVLITAFSPFSQSISVSFHYFQNYGLFGNIHCKFPELKVIFSWLVLSDLTLRNSKELHQGFNPLLHLHFQFFSVAFCWWFSCFMLTFGSSALFGTLGGFPSSWKSLFEDLYSAEPVCLFLTFWFHSPRLSSHFPVSAVGPFLASVTLLRAGLIPFSNQSLPMDRVTWLVPLPLISRPPCPCLCVHGQQGPWTRGSSASFYRRNISWVSQVSCRYQMATPSTRPVWTRARTASPSSRTMQVRLSQWRYLNWDFGFAAGQNFEVPVGVFKWRLFIICWFLWPKKWWVIDYPNCYSVACQPTNEVCIYFLRSSTCSESITSLITSLIFLLVTLQFYSPGSLYCMF